MLWWDSSAISQHVNDLSEKLFLTKQTKARKKVALEKFSRPYAIDEFSAILGEIREQEV